MERSHLLIHPFAHHLIFSAVSIAAINTGVQVSIWALASVLWAIYLLVELLDHMAILCLTF